MCTVETATETENAGIIQTRCFKNRTSSVIAVEHDELEKWDAKKEEITNEKVREKKWKKKKKNRIESDQRGIYWIVRELCNQLHEKQTGHELITKN